MRKKKVKGSKRVTYELIKPDSVVGGPMYRLLRELVDAFHDELAGARIALAWCTSWRPNVDGQVILGKCKKASDLDREVADFDFIILLRKVWWQDTHVSEEQRRALLDHELCHAAVRCDDRTGDPVLDERGRKVYRTRKHDIEEFNDIIRRHGIYTRDLELAAAELLKRARTVPFEPCEACRESPGWVSVDNRVKRCECYSRWAERRSEARLAS